MNNSSAGEQQSFSNSFFKSLGFIPKLNSYVVGSSIVFYIAGFLISNIYLGSLGIVFFDVLRVRYVLIGLVFAFFIALIVFPLYGLVRLFDRIRDKSIVRVISELFLYYLDQFIIIFFASVFLSVLSGAAGTIALGISNISTRSNLLDWMNHSLPTLFKDGFLIWLKVYLPIFLFILSAAAIFSIVMSHRFAEDTETTKIESLYEFIDLYSSKDLLKLIFLPLIFVLLFVTLQDLIRFITSGTLEGTSVIFSSEGGGFIRLGGAAFVAYTFASIFILYGRFMPNRASEVISNNDEPESPLNRKMSSWFLVLMWAAVILFPLYSFGVYPFIPQQVGGGQPELIEIISSDNTMANVLSQSMLESYLIDQTSNYTLIMLIDKNTGNYEIFQLSNSHIVSLSFK